MFFVSGKFDNRTTGKYLRDPDTLVSLASRGKFLRDVSPSPLYSRRFLCKYTKYAKMADKDPLAKLNLEETFGIDGIEI